MRWIEIKIETTSEASEALCEMLTQLGADGVAVCDPEEIREIIESPDSLAYADDGFLDSLGAEVKISAYFAEFADGVRLGIKDEDYQNPEGIGLIYSRIGTQTCSKESLINLITERIASISEFLDVGKGITSDTYVDDEDWANSWKKYYEVLHLTPRIVICPSWENYREQESEVVITLDPGSAFGTGTHETTSMCAEILDRIVHPDQKILDLGCGSGILAIIAKKLQASYVEAIDIDRLATQVAQENIQRNQVEISCHTGELKEAYHQDYNLVVANIVAEVIVDVAGQVDQYLAAEGYFLVSGIIESKAESVLTACRKANFKLLASHQKGDWHAYLYQKTS